MTRAVTRGNVIFCGVFLANFTFPLCPSCSPVSEFWAIKSESDPAALPSTITAFPSKKRPSAKALNLPFFSREPSAILLGRSFSF
jgi:hypothetical protein